MAARFRRARHLPWLREFPLHNPSPVLVRHGVNHLLLGVEASATVPMATLDVAADGEIDDVHGNILFFFSVASEAAMRSSKLTTLFFSSERPTWFSSSGGPSEEVG
jgi:hypothetical protein